MYLKIKNRIIHILVIFFTKIKYKKSQFDKNALLLQFKKVGVNFCIGEDYTVSNPQFVKIGDNFTALNRFRIEAIIKYKNETFKPSIQIGNNVIFNNDIHIGCINNIEIGDNCLFASRIYITDHHHGSSDKSVLDFAPTDRQLISKGPVIIKNNVWIGEGVAIMPGVTIGENSIIGTNAVVTKDVAPNSVMAGVPAKLIKKLI